MQGMNQIQILYQGQDTNEGFVFGKVNASSRLRKNLQKHPINRLRGLVIKGL
jgi:hypothetical protein